MKASVAAGHAATAAVGAEILAEGGTAADAAVAASLASCVAETAMTGLLSGGFAIYLEAATRRVRNLDCFAAVPSGPGDVLIEVDVPFWGESVPYLVGPASFGIPGLAAGLDALWRSYGRLPWARLCEPALRLAQSGVELPPAHAECLRETLAPIYTMNEGARFISRGRQAARGGRPRPAAGSRQRARGAAGGRCAERVPGKHFGEDRRVDGNAGRRSDRG